MNKEYQYKRNKEILSLVVNKKNYIISISKQKKNNILV